MGGKLDIREFDVKSFLRNNSEYLSPDSMSSSVVKLAVESERRNTEERGKWKRAVKSVASGAV